MLTAGRIWYQRRSMHALCQLEHNSYLVNIQKKERRHLKMGTTDAANAATYAGQFGVNGMEQAVIFLEKLKNID